MNDIRPKSGLWKLLPSWVSKHTAHAIYPYVYLPHSTYQDWDSGVASQQIYAVIEHERVHLHRQKELGLLKWLLKYLLSPKFRVGEELLAIKSQLKYLIENQISFELEKMASDLSGPTYLWAIRYDRAIKNLRDLEAEIARSV